MENDNIGPNAVRLVGEFFVPGASQFVAGNIGAGLAHNLLAGAAGVALIGTGAAPVIGALAILGIKLNSFTSAATGRSILTMGTEMIDRERARFDAPARSSKGARGVDATSEAPATAAATGRARDY